MAMHLGDHLVRARILSDLLPLLGEREECFLVGGTLRDSLLGILPSDFDFAFPLDPTPVAKKFAARIGGSWFLLDHERHQSRVVTREGQDLTYDFAPFRAESLNEDLALRDFTMNAMALPLHGSAERVILDPLGGQRDLQNRCLRMCSPDVLEADPLRVLKGIRHCADLGLKPETGTGRQMRRVAPLLSRVAPERVRNELAFLFHLTPAGPGLRLLELFGLDRQLFGEPPAADAGRHQVARWEAFQARLVELHPRAGDFFGEKIEAGFTRGALMKFASWLYPSADLSILERLRLSRHSQALIRGLQGVDPEENSAHLHSLPPTRRGRALQVADLGGPSPENILFVASFMEPEKYELDRVWLLVEDYFACLQDGRIPSLVNGKAVRNLLEISDGPALGRALDAVRREEIAGRVQTPEDATNFLEKYQAEKV